MESTLLINTNCILGESPLWHSQRKSILWVDIEDKKIFELDEKCQHLRSWQLDERVSLLIQIENNSQEILVCVQDGIGKMNLNTQKFEYLVYLEKELKNTRCNDGKCDGKGRLWIGTMNLSCDLDGGNLYCIDNDLSVQRKKEKVTISNGLGWSLKNDRLYYIDSATYKVESYFFDLSACSIKHERTAIMIPHAMGMPDGMAVDAEGMLWIAQWGGFAVNRWNPFTGKMLGSISVASPNVTSCTFGGKNFDSLIYYHSQRFLN